MDLLLLSLFCGAGGLDLGFAQAGFRTVLAIDIYKHAVSTLAANFPHADAVQADLCEPETLELIVNKVGKAVNMSSHKTLGVIGGPPCQGFSVMNASNSHSDPRNQLVFRYAEILRAINRLFDLDFFVFENVPALVSRKYKEHFATACSMFESAGFRISYAVLDSIDFGVPQYRRRVFVVGVNTRHGVEFDFQRVVGVEGSPKSVGDVLRGLPSLNASNDYRRQDFHPNHRSMRPYSPKIAQIEPGDMKRKSFKRLAWDLPSATVAYGHNEVHIHPAKGHQDRRLSTYEAMLLQGFPHDFEFKGPLTAWHRLVSEAVSPPVAKAIAESILEQLRSGSA